MNWLKQFLFIIVCFFNATCSALDGFIYEELNESHYPLCSQVQGNGYIYRVAKAHVGGSPVMWERKESKIFISNNGVDVYVLPGSWKNGNIYNIDDRRSLVCGQPYLRYCFHGIPDQLYLSSMAKAILDIHQMTSTPYRAFSYDR